MKFEDYKNTSRARMRSEEYEIEDGLKMGAYGASGTTFRFTYTKNAEEREVCLRMDLYDMENLRDRVNTFFECDLVKKFYKERDKAYFKEFESLMNIMLDAEFEKKKRKRGRK